MDNLKGVGSNKRRFESLAPVSKEPIESDIKKTSAFDVTTPEGADIERMSDLFSNRSSYDYGYQDFKYLAKNENKRYAENSRNIAHAVIYTDDAGQKKALQYQMPQGNEAFNGIRLSGRPIFHVVTTPPFIQRPL